ncbi:MAG TPA: DUF1588 domain-containing protein [Polyangia bacterium]|nr:DUF1588 domain-containing protein [Polyangia bacterium]
MGTRAILFIAVGAAALSAACQGNRFLVGDDGTGAAGSSAPGGAAGAAVSSGAAGSIAPSGAAGALGSSFPLPITPAEAVKRFGAVLWQEPTVDGAPLAAAQSGQLVTNQDLVPVIDEMLGDPRAMAGVRAFYRWWLGLDGVATAMKDATLFPAYTPQLQSDVAAEPEIFGASLTLQKRATFTDLIEARYSYLTAGLADLYGVVGPTGAAFVQTPLPDALQRAGLLTQPALQVLGSFATRNSPSHRGVQTLSQFLCVDVPPAPPGTQDAALDTREPGVTLRQALAEAVGTQAACEACHLTLDPYGLAFERFDAIGRWRSQDNGAPIDVSNLTLLNLTSDPNAPGSGDPTVDGPVELAQHLAQSDRARTCFAKQWLAYVTGTTASAISDGAVAPTYAAFSASGFDLQTLIVATLISEAFLSPTP